ncbi:lactonase family protein [Natrarchaeobius halalkaliphilus]|uniref:Lactonase family protein n=1 Tax=Natrarchaeobius halalkaliphilus TaxID=1679091 RepID=A0A3N6LZY8_9EURY|nr:lactonase family protein [Natrarchaeobius halalkaliphilus]RQG87814.1 lactonase family protein [Natrarchaeobius halalkaliphilus]
MSETVAFVGTYTDTESEGIYRCRVDEPTGSIDDIELVAATDDPSFLAVDPTHRFLYAVNEVDTGAVTAYRITTGNDLEEINRQSIGPADPCYCSLDRTGNYLFVAHYTGGAVSILPIDDDGSVNEPTVTHHSGSSVDPDRQTAPHPHSIVPGPDTDFVYVPDLGTDDVVVYELDRTAGALRERTSVSVQEGAGPRHIEFDSEGSRAYLINELNSTITAFEWDRRSGELSPIETVSTLPNEFDGDNITADIHVHPSGSFVYGSNRGHDSIAVFELTENGLERLEIVETGGSWPRNFCLGSSGESLWVANAHTDTIVGFELVGSDGTIVQIGSSVSVAKPVCLRPVYPRSSDRVA